VKVEESPSPCPYNAETLAAAVATASKTLPCPALLSAEGASGSDSDSKKKSNRCLSCRKKVGLTGTKILSKKLIRKNFLSRIDNKLVKELYGCLECALRE
jgi:hypothetical protein